MGKQLPHRHKAFLAYPITIPSLSAVHILCICFLLFDLHFLGPFLTWFSLCNDADAHLRLFNWLSLLLPLMWSIEGHHKSTGCGPRKVSATKQTWTTFFMSDAESWIAYSVINSTWHNPEFKVVLCPSTSTIASIQSPWHEMSARWFVTQAAMQCRLMMRAQVWGTSDNHLRKKITRLV